MPKNDVHPHLLSEGSVEIFVRDDVCGVRHSDSGKPDTAQRPL
jgi:hypothetical protein